MRRKPVLLIALWVVVLLLLGVVVFGPGHQRWDWDDGPGRGWAGMGYRGDRYQGPVGTGWFGMNPRRVDGWGYGGMGPDMMGWGPAGLFGLDLSDQQRGRIHQIQDELQKKNWVVMGRMLEEEGRMRALMASETPDPAAVGKASMVVADLQRQMLESAVEARNSIAALLTPEQQAKWRQQRRFWWHNSAE